MTASYSIVSPTPATRFVPTAWCAAGDTAAAPWPVIDDPYGMVTLSAASTDEEVGSVVLELARTSDVVVAGRTAEEVVGAIVAYGRWLGLEGGIEVRDGEERWITPGDCGLNQWREWEQFLETGRATVVGWEPDVGLEGDGTVVRIWSATRMMGRVAQIFVPEDGAIGVEMRRDRFAAFLRNVEADLRGFLGRLDEWARQYAPRWADALVARFDHAFEISSRMSPDAGPVPAAFVELHATLDHLRTHPVALPPHDPRRPSSPGELRRGGRHCPFCLFPMAVRRRHARPCTVCGAHPAAGARCLQCESTAVWEGGADAACLGCGVHGPKRDVLA